jgi:hypothetical protein
MASADRLILCVQAQAPGMVFRASYRNLRECYSKEVSPWANSATARFWQLWLPTLSE